MVGTDWSRPKRGLSADDGDMPPPAFPPVLPDNAAEAPPDSNGSNWVMRDMGSMDGLLCRQYSESILENETRQPCIVSSPISTWNRWHGSGPGCDSSTKYAMSMRYAPVDNPRPCWFLGLLRSFMNAAPVLPEPSISNFDGGISLSPPFAPVTLDTLHPPSRHTVILWGELGLRPGYAATSVTDKSLCTPKRKFNGADGCPTFHSLPSANAHSDAAAVAHTSGVSRVLQTNWLSVSY